jgi:hypothetical protein
MLSDDVVYEIAKSFGRNAISSSSKFNIISPAAAKRLCLEERIVSRDDNDDGGGRTIGIDEDLEEFGRLLKNSGDGWVCVPLHFKNHWMVLMLKNFNNGGFSKSPHVHVVVYDPWKNGREERIAHIRNRLHLSWGAFCGIMVDVPNRLVFTELYPQNHQDGSLCCGIYALSFLLIWSQSQNSENRYEHIMAFFVNNKLSVEFVDVVLRPAFWKRSTRSKVPPK